MSDAATIPDGTAARVARLINEAEDMRQQAADDLKQIYADLREELKSLGWDGKHVSAEVAALKGAIGEMRLDEKAKEKREEKGERVDDYVSLLTRARARGEHKNDRREGESNAKLIATVATGMQTETGRKALVTALDIMIEREEAEDRRSDAGVNIVTKHTEITASPAEAAVTAGDDLREPVAAEQGQIIREGDAPRETDRLGGDASCPDTDQPGTATELPDALEPTRGEHQAIASSEHGRSHGQAAGRTPESQMDGETDPVTAGETAPHTDQPLTGGDHVDGNALRVPTSVTGEGAASALPELDQFVEDVPPTPMKRLHYAHCFPELTKAEYGRLEFSIIGIGVSKPIIRMGDVIVDGWARYNICRTLGISYPIQNYSGNDVLLDVIEWQRASRNFTPAQEKKIAADLAKEIPHRADDIMAAFGLAEEAMEAAE